MFTTFPPSIKLYGGVSVQPPAKSIRTGLRPHTIWSGYTERRGCCLWSTVEVSPSRIRLKAFSSSRAISSAKWPSESRSCNVRARNIASLIRVINGAEEGRGAGNSN